MNLEKYIADVKDFPSKGILFKDITPLLADGDAFSEAVRLIKEFTIKQKATIIVGPESRGFIFGCPVANDLKLGFIPIRKPGKLPRETIDESYDLEYGSNTLSVHKDSIKKGDKVIIVDDLLATGGTVEATIKLINRLGGEVVGVACLIELIELKGRELLKDVEVFSILKY